VIGAFHSTAVDPRNGNLYAVWTDARFNGGQYDSIAFSRSTDGGVTWSDPVQVNQTPTNIPALDRQAWYPTVAVAADGTIGISYYDLRFNDPSKGCLTDCWLVQCPASKSSTDPACWTSETRLTDTSFDIEQSVRWNQGGAYAYWLGDYQGLAAVDNGFAAVWAQPFAGSPDHILFRSLNASPLASLSAAGLGGRLANILATTLTVSSSTLSDNWVIGGTGAFSANGGNGFGDDPYNDGTSTTNVAGRTVTTDAAVVGASDSGTSDGPGIGSNAYLTADGIACLDYPLLLALAGNMASTSSDNLFGVFTM
jgi:hypothetical protein